MTQEVVLFLVGQFIVMASALIWAYASLSSRLVRIETIIEIMGIKAANVLHSPHTPELDGLLEKYVDRHYELSNEQWTRLLELCDEIEQDTTNPKDQRALAAIVSAVCCHKLKKLPPKFNNHSQ